jgi:Rad3-related DNA helicase
MTNDWIDPEEILYAVGYAYRCPKDNDIVIDADKCKKTNCPYFRGDTYFMGRPVIICRFKRERIDKERGVK